MTAVLVGYLDDYLCDCAPHAASKAVARSACLDARPPDAYDGSFGPVEPVDSFLWRCLLTLIPALLIALSLTFSFFNIFI